ncbi:hypothetical protein CRD60_03875 [Bifidobacterium aemilianum]|uniref:R3H domain-containing protein n=1 Tax=Bifidobacterium aemilianum TaxID=2493120 RepID=A0A366K9E9_9BIFI|nr:R3H domain-containing nucleic acid-binding protein [Bifidobacterium aemilianum]RBP97753.1 hypothetical protein CRD60_03875 [Bifidobacterium aemilianum]
MGLDDERTIDQLNEEADIAADYLEGLLDIADFEGDIEMGVRNHRPTVQIVADDDTDIKLLIGRKGEVVDALQQLTRLAVQEKTGERSHLILDVDGYLKKRRERLQDMALDTVDEVRDTGKTVDLKPMNSFERKIVHDLVRKEGLKSRSHGEEPHRYVSVYLPAKSAEGEPEEDDEILDAVGPEDMDTDYTSSRRRSHNDADVELETDLIEVDAVEDEAELNGEEGKE